MTTEKEQRVDHVAMAKHWLDTPKNPQSGQKDTELARAQVHASLAIAEQLERLNETLKEAPELLNQIAVGVNR